MQISTENSVIFESYSSNSLSQEEVLAFEAKLDQDSDFKMQFEHFEKIEASIKYHFHRSQLKAKFDELDAKMDTRVSKQKITYLKWFVVTGAAASILLVATLYLKNSKSANFNQELVAENWPHEEGLPVKMSNKSRYDDAMNAFKLENWTEAKKKLVHVDSDTSTYFLGIIAFHKNELKSSVNYFQEVKSNSAYYSDAQFRLALVSILNNDLTLAKDVLKQLEDQKSQYSSEASQILKQI